MKLRILDFSGKWERPAHAAFTSYEGYARVAVLNHEAGLRELVTATVARASFFHQAYLAWRRMWEGGCRNA